MMMLLQTQFKQERRFDGDDYGGIPLMRGMADQSLSNRRGADRSSSQPYLWKAIDVMKACAKDDISNETGA